MKNFPNGFDMWQETHFEMVSFICLTLQREGAVDCPLKLFRNRHGSAEVMGLARQMTDAFEEQYQDYFWDGEWYDTLETFQLDYIKNLQV